MTSLAELIEEVLGRRICRGDRPVNSRRRAALAVRRLSSVGLGFFRCEAIHFSSGALAHGRCSGRAFGLGLGVSTCARFSVPRYGETHLCFWRARPGAVGAGGPRRAPNGGNEPPGAKWSRVPLNGSAAVLKERRTGVARAAFRRGTP